ncbi:MAG TPA: amidohydrolase family protein [Patescibacteria group bacterium]|jgi:N-acyl-D-amino-acid deacylase|nr:amidohydrolase family protein [Patescibacteria group bacterium]
MYDILIKNGTVIDGTGQPGRKLDVAFSGGKISDIAENIPAAKALTTLDAKDKLVVPGFIDIQNHSDSYWTLFDQPEQMSLLAQGITTIIIGNCGSSLAPLSTPEAIKTIQKWHSLSGVNVNWSTFAELLSVLKKKKIGVNVGSLVGHATIRRGLLSDQIRSITPDELSIMDKQVRTALDEGALGLSMGLVYAHEVNSTFDELLTLTSELKRQRKYLSIHLRSEGSHILEGLDEILVLASDTGIPVKISHLKIQNKKNWHLFDRVINKLENAYHQGIKISFDAYPYGSTWSVLYTYLPKWAYEGGRLEILRRINSEMDRRKILDYLKAAEYDYKNIIIADAEENEVFIGKTISDIARNQNVSEPEAVLNILSACKAQVIIFDHNLLNEHVELFASSPLSMIATDGAGYSKTSVELVHPRCYGTMPRFLRMVREKRILSWEQAIKKITLEPAQLLGLQARGVIKKGAAGDAVIFDPNKITDHADYNHPYQLPTGIDAVLVNGKLSLKQNEIKELTGQVIAR